MLIPALLLSMVFAVYSVVFADLVITDGGVGAFTMTTGDGDCAATKTYTIKGCGAIIGVTWNNCTCGGHHNQNWPQNCKC